MSSAGRRPRLRDAFDAQRTAIETQPDPVAAFHRATELRDEADAIVGDAAILRAGMALRVMEAEGLSLAQLADRLGISKARADQFVRVGRAARAQSSP